MWEVVHRTLKKYILNSEGLVIGGAGEPDYNNSDLLPDPLRQHFPN